MVFAYSCCRRRWRDFPFFLHSYSACSRHQSTLNQSTNWYITFFLSFFLSFCASSTSSNQPLEKRCWNSRITLEQQFALITLIVVQNQNTSGKRRHLKLWQNAKKLFFFFFFFFFVEKYKKVGNLFSNSSYHSPGAYFMTFYKK
jgi:hypothetical protein